MDTRKRDLVSSLEYSALARPDAPLFGIRGPDGWRWLSYGEIAAHVDVLRAALARLGVVAGDRVAIIANNRPE
jgi:long-chain acyl-CoA synthetase